MRTKAFRTASWLIVAATLALAAACTPNMIRPTELQLDAIEATLRARLLPENLLDLKLHVFEHSETSLFVAYRGTFVAPDGKRSEVYGMKIEHVRADGSPVSDPAAIAGIYTYAVDCTTLVGDPASAVLEKGPGNSGLKYQGAGKWHFNWKTPKSYAASCHMMYVLLGDGAMSPEVMFTFK